MRNTHEKIRSTLVSWTGVFVPARTVSTCFFPPRCPLWRCSQSGWLWLSSLARSSFWRALLKNEHNNCPYGVGILLMPMGAHTKCQQDMTAAPTLKCRREHDSVLPRSPTPNVRRHPLPGFSQMRHCIWSTPERARDHCVAN